MQVVILGDGDNDPEIDALGESEELEHVEGDGLGLVETVTLTETVGLWDEDVLSLNVALFVMEIELQPLTEPEGEAD